MFSFTRCFTFHPPFRCRSTSMRSSISGARARSEVPVAERNLKRILIPVGVVFAAAATLLYMRAERQPRELIFSGTLEARTVNVRSLVAGRGTKVPIADGYAAPSGHVVA